MQNHIDNFLFSETKLDVTSENQQFKIICSKTFRINRNKNGCGIMFYKMYIFLKIFLANQ